MFEKLKTVAGIAAALFIVLAAASGILIDRDKAAAKREAREQTAVAAYACQRVAYADAQTPVYRCDDGQAYTPADLMRRFEKEHPEAQQPASFTTQVHQAPRVIDLNKVLPPQDDGAK